MNTLLQISQILGLLAFIALLWLMVRAFKNNIIWGFAILLLSPVSAIVFGIKYWNNEKIPFLAYMTTFVMAVGLGLYVFTAWGGWDVARTALRVQLGIQSQTLNAEDAFEFMNANLDFIEKASLNAQEQKKVALIRQFLNQHGADMTHEDSEILHGKVVDLMEDENLNAAQRGELELMRRQLAQNKPGTPDRQAATRTSETTREDTTPRLISKRPSTKKAQYLMDYMEIEASEARNYVGNTFKVTRRNSREQEVRLIGVSPGRLRFEQRVPGGTLAYEYRIRDIEKLKLLARITD